jgi:hypothetical protein
MMKRSLLTFVEAFLAMALLVTAPARAENCPIPSLEADQVEQLIVAEPNCRAAYGILRECQRGVTSDVHLARIVIAKCEQSFRGRLSDARQRSYEQERESCARQGIRRGGEGSLGASMRATCQAGVASRFSASK